MSAFIFQLYVRKYRMSRNFHPAGRGTTLLAMTFPLCLSNDHISRVSLRAQRSNLSVTEYESVFAPKKH